MNGRLEYKLICEYPYQTLITIMVVVFPLIVIPNPLSYVYLPKFLFLTFISLVILIYMIKDMSRLSITEYPVLLIFLVLIFLSVLFSDNLMTAWGGSANRFTGLLTYLFCAILFLAANRSVNYLALIKAMVFGAVIVSTIAVFQYYGLNVVPSAFIQEGWIGHRSFGTLGNPNFLATYTVFILPASMMLYFHLFDKQWLVSSCIIFSALIVSLTRGAWLAFAVLYVMFIIYSFNKPGIRRRLFIAGVLFVLIFLLLSVTSDNSIIGRTATISGEIADISEYTGSSASVRVLIWQKTLIIIQDNWLFGVGPDNLRIPLPTGNLEDKAHNIFLEIAATMGIFAFAAFLFFLFLCLRKRGSWFKNMLTFMIIAYLLQGQFNIDVVMNMPLFWIVLGLTQAGNSERITLNEGKCSMKNKPGSAMFDSRVISYSLAIGLILFSVFVAALFFYPRTGTIELNGYSTYEGQIRGVNTYHGFGVLNMENGFSYTGYFKYGFYDGEGVIEYSDGSYYVGEFREGYYHGQGKLVLSNGETQEGFFSRGICTSD